MRPGEGRECAVGQGRAEHAHPEGSCLDDRVGNEGRGEADQDDGGQDRPPSLAQQFEGVPLQG